MKKNKKAILGFAVAMVFSLAFMQGVCKYNSDVSLQQVSVGAGYMAGETEGGASGAWASVAGMTGSYAAGGAIYGVSTIYATGTNPVGWVYWGTVGLSAL